MFESLRAHHFFAPFPLTQYPFLADTRKVLPCLKAEPRQPSFPGPRLLQIICAAVALTNTLQAIPPEERLSNLSIRRWGPESGIPEETFSAVLAPGDGYIWLSSNHGLVRFDGQRAQIFRLGDSFRPGGTGPCSTNTLSTLLLGSDGSIWSGASSGCLFRILQDRFGTFANFQLEGITSPLLDRDNVGIMALRNLAGNQGIEINRRSAISTITSANPSGETNSIAAPPGLQILFSARDNTNRLWAIMNDNKLYDAGNNATTWTMRYQIPSSARRLLADKEGNLWISSIKGLYRWRDGETKHWGKSEGLPKDEIVAIHKDKSGCVWMGLDQSIARLCDDKIESIALGQEQEEILSSMAEDPQGNLWFGGRWGNLYRLSPGIFRIYTRREGLSESHLTGVAIDRDGNAWGSHRNSGLVRLTAGRVANTFTNPEIAETQTLIEHPASGILAATATGIFHATPQGIQPIRTDSPLNYRTLPGLFWESPTQLLYSTMASNFRLTIHQINGQESWRVEELSGPVRIRQMAKDASGQIWALSQFRGLYKLVGNTYQPAPNADPERARAWYSLTADQQGLLWIGTTDGLEIYSPTESRFLNTKPLLGGDQVFHIAQDRFGKFWCTTRLGLARFSRKQALANLSQSSLQVERYGDAQSLPTTNFGLVTSASGATDPQGRMWFPGLRGLVSVNPADFEFIPRPPVPLILAINTDGTARDLNRPQQIPPGLKKIEFVFQTIRLDSLGGDFCRLKMQGFDPDWIPCNESRTAQYTNLPPAKYEFLLQTSSQADQWNGKQISIPLTIEPAYYQLLWVRILALLLVCAFAWQRYTLSLKRTRLLEEKVEERTVELESAMLAAQSANRAKTEFLATMSHEIRTPMNGVLGAVQILNDSPLNPDQQKLVNVIRQSGEDLVGIVDDILSLSKVEAGKLNLEKTTVAIPALCENLVSLFQPKAAAKGILLSVLLEDSAPKKILSDPQRLRQILLNLIGNAVKFTDQGHVLLRVNSDPATQTICFHVEDTGLGIPKDKIATLFDPFVQADSSTTRRFGGSGLGLAIVHRFVEAMQGSVEIESEPGRGSTFRARFPLETAPDLLEPAQPAEATPNTLGGLKVLIAEDNPVNQMVFERMLLRLGCQVRMAKNGREALSILSEESVDLILMDCQMPELDGYQTTTEIRSMGGIYTSLPIIALTASAMIEDRERCLAVGMNDFLSKPVLLATLQKKLAEWSDSKVPAKP